METMDVSSSEDGVDTVDMDPEEVAVAIAASASKTPKRRREIQLVPGAPKKLKPLSSPKIRPTVPQYKWQYVDQRDRLVSGGAVWSYSRADTYNEAERLKPTYAALNRVPRDISLKVDQRLVDKPTPGQVLRSVVYKYASDRIGEKMHRYCEGCTANAGGQLAHMAGCLEDWDRAVEKYGLEAMKEAKCVDCHMWCRNLLEFFDYPVDKVPPEVTAFVDGAPKDQILPTLKKMPVADAFIDLCKFLKPSSDF